MNKDIIIFILFLVCVILCGICLGQKMRYEWIIKQIKYNIKKIKAKAIKEFIKGLKKYNESIYSEFKAKIINEDIDNFAKEMVGDAE